MNTVERIWLQPRSMLDELHVAEALQEKLSITTGFIFSIEGSVARGEGKYRKENCKKVEEIVAEECPELEVRHSVWSEYSSKELIDSQLVELSIPETFFGGADIETVCKKCESRSFDPALADGDAVRVASASPAFLGNGQLLCVNETLKTAISEQLEGVSFIQTASGDSYLLRSSDILSPLLIKEDESIGFKGYCDVCNSPMFAMLFGPLRFPSDSWSGYDIAFAKFRDGYVFSQKAASLFIEHDPNIVRLRPVYLE